MGFFAFAGGMASQHLFSAVISSSVAEDSGNPNIVQYRDINGRTRLEVGVINGEAGENLYGEDGKPRLQLGTYDGSVTSDEKGLPAVTFYDNEGRLKMLLRVAAGKNQSPVLIMKDNEHRDRIVLGLGLNDENEEPFLAYFDKDGGKHLAFGAY